MRTYIHIYIHHIKFCLACAYLYTFDAYIYIFIYLCVYIYICLYVQPRDVNIALRKNTNIMQHVNVEPLVFICWISGSFDIWMSSTDAIPTVYIVF